MTLLSAGGLTFGYDRSRDALREVDLAIEAGEVVGLLGRNGAGKTTLIHCLLGLLVPAAGRVSVFGHDPHREPIAVKRRLGHVSEEDLLPPGARVGEIVDLHRALFPSWDETLADEIASRFELARDRRVRHLSKGQKRQVALLCAVAHRPELLVLDEPAGGLDPAARREFLETAIRLLAEGGTTVLFSSHYMHDVERLAERVVLLHEGRVRLDAPLDELRERCSLAVVPAHNGTAGRLASLGSVLSVRPRGDVVHAAVAAPPREAESLLAEALGQGVRCSTLNLEDLFVELVG